MSVNWIDVAVSAFSAWGVLRLDIAYRRYRGRHKLGIRSVAPLQVEAKVKVAAFVRGAAHAQECHKCHENVHDYAVMINNEVRCMNGCADV